MHAKGIEHSNWKLQQNTECYEIDQRHCQMTTFNTKHNVNTVPIKSIYPTGYFAHLLLLYISYSQTVL